MDCVNSLRCVAAVAAATCFLPATPSWPADVRQYSSPDGQLRARIGFSKNSPTATPESRVTITAGAKVVFERSYESEDGEHGFGVERAAWTPDSRFLVFSLSSSGGHQAWHFPTDFWCRADARVRRLDDYIGPITSAEFSVSRPDVVTTEGRKDDLEEAELRASLRTLLEPRGKR